MKIEARWGKWSPWVEKKQPELSRERSRDLFIGPYPVMRHTEVIVPPSDEPDRLKRHLWAPGRYHGLHVPRVGTTTYYRSRTKALAPLKLVLRHKTTKVHG